MGKIPSSCPELAVKSVMAIRPSHPECIGSILTDRGIGDGPIYVYCDMATGFIEVQVTLNYLHETFITLQDRHQSYTIAKDL
jgi:hypothetical protein